MIWINQSFSKQVDIYHFSPKSKTHDDDDMSTSNNANKNQSWEGLKRQTFSIPIWINRNNINNNVMVDENDSHA